MEKSRFELYCRSLAKMELSHPEWKKGNLSILADYIAGGADYGYGAVLKHLAIPAYKVIKEEYVDKNMSKKDLELADLMFGLMSRAPISDYRASAYYFAICVVGASLFDIEVVDAIVDTFDENEFFTYDQTTIEAGSRSPLHKKLKKYSLKLCDFSQSNPLVTFRPAGVGRFKKTNYMYLYCADPKKTLAYITKSDKSIVKLASWAKLGKLKMAYTCKRCGGVDFFDFVNDKTTQPAMPCKVCDKDNVHDRRSMGAFREFLTCLPHQGYQCECGSQLTADAIIASALKCPHCGRAVAIDRMPIISVDQLKGYQPSEMVCSSKDALAKSIAKNLVTKARSMEQNFGLHVLYLAYGFLKWTDQKNTTYNSPILLCPINMDVDKSTGEYYFTIDHSSNHTFEVNQTLVQMLKAYSSTYSITMPELTSDNLPIYINLLKASFYHAQGGLRDVVADWEVSEVFGVGCFHYQKLQLQQDIDDNQDEYLEHPVIRRLCGDDDAVIAGNAQVLDRPSMQYMVLDADSSQEEVIKAAQEGRSFILQGPPGSGKSQTITNIIASSLGQGKTVLFVTEKASARSVIYDNLARMSVGSGASLTDFVLDFVNLKVWNKSISKTSLVKELNRCLAVTPRTGGYYQLAMQTEEFWHDSILKYMRQMRGDHQQRNYMRMLQDVAPYVEYDSIVADQHLPLDSGFLELVDTMCRYYNYANQMGFKLTYQANDLASCTGCIGNNLITAARGYVGEVDKLSSVVDKLVSYGWTAQLDRTVLEECLAELKLWVGMPKLPTKVLYSLRLSSLDSLIERAIDRRTKLESVLKKYNSQLEEQFDEQKAREVDVYYAKSEIDKYAFPLMRIGKKYDDCKNYVLQCLSVPPKDKCSYAVVKDVYSRLYEYHTYLYWLDEYSQGKQDDLNRFGVTFDSVAEWTDFITELEKTKSIVLNSNEHVCNASAISWSELFMAPKYQRTVAEIAYLIHNIEDGLAEVDRLEGDLVEYVVPTAKKPLDMLEWQLWAKMVVASSSKLAAWYQLYEIMEKIREKSWVDILDELVATSTTTAEVEGRLHKTYHTKCLAEYVKSNGLDAIRDFNRDSHASAIRDYADADVEVISKGASRVYDALTAYLHAGAVYSSTNTGKYKQLQARTGYSVKKQIAADWNYIKLIKPCFMMSPLNVSQYIDINITFDLVVFDEASQIFMEDALAAIKRGKQVIIAGDSKQLPPSDFFRATDGASEDSMQYYEDEGNIDNSLLTCTERVLNEESVALCWHYRSCDESLIAFANQEMEYNLITFPSAAKNPNDGIRYIHVPYDVTKCYDSGKGTHVNKGEVEAVLELIYQEMTHRERSGFSIGVVAFNNAQAEEIELQWEAYKNHPSRAAQVAEWEKAHEKEPLMFCNLETVQGDERDTIIISIGYSPDATDRFVLTNLGCVRYDSGRKRINVAVTRARHQMYLVAMLEAERLHTTIATSLAPAENKAGAVMLEHFINYAKTFSNDNRAVCAPTDNLLVQSICKVLDQEGIAYDTEIGRSDCKIDIGIKKPGRDNEYVMGIIVDNPNRADFDSVREYTRLTEQILTKKYGWRIHRVFPIAWINDYRCERDKLLSAIRRITALR